MCIIKYCNLKLEHRRWKCKDFGSVIHCKQQFHAKECLHNFQSNYLLSLKTEMDSQIFLDFSNIKVPDILKPSSDITWKIQQIWLIKWEKS